MLPACDGECLRGAFFAASRALTTVNALHVDRLLIATMLGPSFSMRFSMSRQSSHSAWQSRTVISSLGRLASRYAASWIAAVRGGRYSPMTNQKSLGGSMNRTFKMTT